VTVDERADGRVLAQPLGSGAADGRLDLGELLAGGHAQPGPRLHDPQAGDLQRQVLAVGRVDQAIERRITE
jgi:hypothetical protein